MPDWSKEIRERLAGVALDPAREASIVEEIAQHLEDRYAELIAGGAAPEAARKVALDELAAAPLSPGRSPKRFPAPRLRGSLRPKTAPAGYPASARISDTAPGACASSRSSPWSRSCRSRSASAPTRRFSSCSTPSACAACRSPAPGSCYNVRIGPKEESRSGSFTSTSPS